MKEVLLNYDNLDIKDIDEVVVRTKALIIDDNDNILLGYCNNVYQFPGGHLNDGETIDECLIREVMEETGIDIKDIPHKLFMRTTYRTKNYRDTKLNRQNEIYYYIVRTNLKYNKMNTRLDEYEKDGNYTVKEISLKDVYKTLETNKKSHIGKIIADEMIEALKEYNNIK